MSATTTSRRAAGRRHPGAAGLSVCEEHLLLHESEPRHGAILATSTSEVAIQLRLDGEHEPPYQHQRIDVDRRPDPLRRQPVPRLRSAIEPAHQRAAAVRLQSEINISTSRFVDVRSDTEVFDVKIFRTRTTYQFTNRLVVRNILIQHLRQDGRRQRALYLPRQRRHGVLRGLRRSLPAGPKHRRSVIPTSAMMRDEPGDLHEAAVSVQVLAEPRRAAAYRGALLAGAESASFLTGP